MQFSSVLLSFFRFLLPPTLIGVIYLYSYPFITGCFFPLARPAEAACFIPGSQRPAVPAEIAPFRLLTLADPQLEGDTSLPHPNAPLFPSLQHLKQAFPALNSLRLCSSELVTQDIPRLLQSYRKRLDLLGNDYYLAHIYRSVKWWTDPTHTVVLGDLLGSQWISDDEFEIRAERFWKRVFHGAEPVPPSITGVSGRFELLGDDERWGERIIAVAGNHDIGYAGDIHLSRIARFEQRFGHVNWDVEFRMNKDDHHSMFKPAAGALRLVILNSMNLDAPAYDDGLRQQSLDHMHGALGHQSSDGTATIILTHIPLHKEAGICVDSPMITHFPSDQGGGIREQNHLRLETSQSILNLLKSQALILTGHDHEGCDTLHTIDPNHVMNGSEQAWSAKPFGMARHLGLETDGIREITVRSMMGSFGGNAGLLSAWYDQEEKKWKFEYATCVAGVQHIWWAVHVLVLIEIGIGLAGLSCSLLEQHQAVTRVKKKME